MSTLTQTIMANLKSTLILNVNPERQNSPSIEIKVNLGCEINCHFPISLVCKPDGLPKQMALEPTLSLFAAYNELVHAQDSEYHH